MVGDGFDGGEDFVHRFQHPDGASRGHEEADSKLAVCCGRGGFTQGGVGHDGIDGKYVGLAALERATEETEEVVDGSGLLGGLTAYHIRILCENPWEGGGGYLISEVAKMTLDQVWFRLCDREILKRPVGGRTEKMASGDVTGTLKPDRKGYVRGRAADGTPIKAKIRGKSLARELMEQQEKKLRKQKKRRKGG